MSFQVTILGSGSAIPTSRRNPTSQYVDCANRSILIDCGEGTQMQMRKFGVKFQKIDIVLISHLHGDHYFGLIGLMSTMHLMGRVKLLRIIAPKGLRALIELQLKTSYAFLGYDFEVVELDENFDGVVFEDEKMRIESFPLRHKIPTQGYVVVRKEKERKLLAEKAERDGVKIEFFHRLKKGEDVTKEDGTIILSDSYTLPGDPEKKYAFCSDTEYFEGVLPFIQSVDVLYHEATFLEEMTDRAKETKHSTARQAAQIASKAKVKRLLLGHLSARYDEGNRHTEEAKAVFENVEVVEDGNCYDI